MWFILALLSALFSSFRKVNDKQLSHDIHHLHLAWMMKVAALPVTAFIAVLTSNFIMSQPLSAAFWLSLIISTFLTAPLDKAVYLQGLKYGQLSKTAPLLSLYPALMLVAGALFLNQMPTIGAVGAVLIIVVGVFALNTSNGNMNLFRNIWSNRGTRFGLIGVATISLHMTVSSIAVLESSPLFYGFWATLLSCFVQFAYAEVIAPGKYRQSHISMLAKNGSIQAIGNTLYYLAISVGPIAYVTAIRSLSGALSAILGARAFQEGLDGRKLVALALIATGAIVLSIAN